MHGLTCRTTSCTTDTAMSFFFLLSSICAVDLVRANLPKLLNLLVDATPQWFELGLQLGIDQTTLKIIERDNRDMTRRCFIEMLSEWLKMIDPLPSWEGLIAVLKLPSVGHKCLAKTVETELGMAVVHEEASGKGLAASTAMGVVHGEASTTNMGVVHGEASGMRLPASITLVIEKEEYSITEQPPESSGLVIALKDDLYGELNLKEMVDKLKSVARLIRITYYATGAAPPVKEVQDIRIDMYCLGNNISRLIDQSAMASFQSTSGIILTELQTVYKYLLDSKEVMAMDNLAERTEKMAGAAERMKNRFEEQAEEVGKIVLKTITCKSELEIEVAEFLHHAVSALKGLRVVMQEAVFFWKTLQEHCQTLAEDRIKKHVEKIMSIESEEKRVKLWTSRAFKIQAITYFAKWVAFYSMCGDYQGEIALTQKELYLYITEKPTREECMAKLHELLSL